MTVSSFTEVAFSEVNYFNYFKPVRAVIVTDMHSAYSRK